MGEHKANITRPSLLVVRLEEDRRETMVAEIKMEPAFLLMELLPGKTGVKQRFRMVTA